MKLFHWPHSTALENYSAGDIIVLAEDLQAARNGVREYAADWLRKHHRDWWFDDEGHVDPEYAEDYSNWMAKLDLDLVEEPGEVDHPIFVMGSE